MPRVLEKQELLRTVVDASHLDEFWLDTVRPSGEQALLTVPKSLLGLEVQVVYVPIMTKNEAHSAKNRLHALMARTPRRDGDAYSFRRKDAYEEDLA